MSTSSRSSSRMTWPRFEAVVCDHGLEADVVTSNTGHREIELLSRMHLTRAFVPKPLKLKHSKVLSQICIVKTRT
ncbi:hypothetical protein SASPL_152917 [Salvia splendens]|uniref:Uncharacterized protein n=1 Tax=Salvia splendens TaxID=180675 RepID=A0A8X8W443_SALSN|nr:hypothetical protein SASPL_152917 [Salvia splendens]